MARDYSRAEVLDIIEREAQERSIPRDHFMRFLSDAYPHLVDGYTQLYARKYAPSAYRKEVQAVVAAARKKHGIAERERPEKENGARPMIERTPEQRMLEWSRPR